MKSRLKKLFTMAVVSLALLAGLVGVVAAAPAAAYAANECAIGTTEYATLDDALAAIIDDTPTTITLLADITYDGGCAIADRTITFDLAGYDLVFEASSSSTLDLTDSDIDYADRGNGSFQAIGGTRGLFISGGSCELTYAEANSTFGAAIYASGGSQVIVDGDLSAAGMRSIGAYAEAASDVTVNGGIAVNGSLANGVSVLNASQVTITGNITMSGGSNNGIYAIDRSVVDVVGDIVVQDDYSCGVYSERTDTKVSVKGNITADGLSSKGIDAVDNGDIKVLGNVSAAGTGGIGAVASNNGKATITGTLTVSPTGNYTSIDGTAYAATEYATSTTLPHYLTYTNDNTSTVWVLEFMPVADIAGVPTAATVGIPLALSGVVEPNDATNQAIVWSIASAGATGATLSGNVLSATAPGTVVVTATIANGLAPGVAFTKNFAITVSSAANGLPAGGIPGTGDGASPAFWLWAALASALAIAVGAAAAKRRAR
ncbi:MAG: hypothetical protein FWD72_00005 [Eggerthellaceae bacterium]|nr:hypothetical protein [Eggerthellaceae bacterium]